MAKIAITGAAGYIGSALVQALKPTHDIRALTRTSHGADVARTGMWVTGDIRDDRVWVPFLEGADVLIHLAAAGVLDHNASPDALLASVVGPLPAMFRIAKQEGVRRILVAGSCVEYGVASSRVGERPLREDDLVLPTNSYGSSKAAATMVCRGLALHYGIPCLIPRFFTIYGGNEPVSRLFPSIMAMARDGGEIKTTDGRQIRDFVHIDDAVAAIISMIDPLHTEVPEGAHVYNVASGTPVRVRDAIASLIERLALPISRWRAGALRQRALESQYLVGDATKIEQDFGWRSTIGLDEGLQRMAAQGEMPGRGADGQMP